MATGDVILDFTSRDVIDLHLIDANSAQANDQAFSFIGSSAFTAAGQLRYTLDGIGNTLLQADINGDHVADFQMTLQGYTQALVRGDFVL